MIKKITAAAFIAALTLSGTAFAAGTGAKAVKFISTVGEVGSVTDAGNDGNDAGATNSAVTLPLTDGERPVTVNEPNVNTNTNANANADTGTVSGITEKSGLEIDKVNVPEDTTVLITLSADKSSDSGTLTVYKKAAGNGKNAYEQMLSAPAKIGKNGLYKEKEGDSKTPVGIFKMNTPFGRKDRLSGFPANYIKADGNYYWNGDSESDKYNKLVNTAVYTDFDKKKSEHIIDYGNYYNYCIDTGYNAEGTPYKGSAIYLHCVVNNENTHGCIAIPESDMISIMRLYDEGHTYIAIYDNADVQAMYKK